MDYNHSKGLFYRITAGGIVLLLFHSAAMGLFSSSYSVVVGQSFGDPNEKNWVNTEIFVPDEGKVVDIDIALDLKHTSFCDLVIIIECPDGFAATISCYNKYNLIRDKKSLGWIILDNESTLTVDETAQLLIGPYKPSGKLPLSAFYDRESYGLWKIRICDAIYHNTGTLDNARIDMVINPEPSSFILAAMGALILFKAKRR